MFLGGTDGPRRTVQIVIYGHARDKAGGALVLPPHAAGRAWRRAPARERRSRNCRCDASWIGGRAPRSLPLVSCASRVSMVSHPRRITRALLSVSDKTGLVDFAKRAGRLRRRAGLDRRHRQGAEGGRAGGHRRRRADRLSRNDGRPRQDAAPEGARRPAGDPRQQGARRRDGSSTASSRSICWW